MLSLVSLSEVWTIKAISICSQNLITLLCNKLLIQSCFLLDLQLSIMRNLLFSFPCKLIKKFMFLQVPMQQSLSVHQEAENSVCNDSRLNEFPDAIRLIDRQSNLDITVIMKMQEIVKEYFRLVPRLEQCYCQISTLTEYNKRLCNILVAFENQERMLLHRLTKLEETTLEFMNEYCRLHGKQPKMLKKNKYSSLFKDYDLTQLKYSEKKLQKQFMNLDYRDRLCQVLAENYVTKDMHLQSKLQSIILAAENQEPVSYANQQHTVHKATDLEALKEIYGLLKSYNQQVEDLQKLPWDQSDHVFELFQRKSQIRKLLKNYEGLKKKKSTAKKSFPEDILQNHHRQQEEELIARCLILNDESNPNRQEALLKSLSEEKKIRMTLNAERKKTHRKLVQEYETMEQESEQAKRQFKILIAKYKQNQAELNQYKWREDLRHIKNRSASRASESVIVNQSSEEKKSITSIEKKFDKSLKLIQEERKEDEEVTVKNKQENNSQDDRVKAHKQIQLLTTQIKEHQQKARQYRDMQHNVQVMSAKVSKFDQVQQINIGLKTELQQYKLAAEQTQKNISYIQQKVTDYELTIQSCQQIVDNLLKTIQQQGQESMNSLTFPQKIELLTSQFQRITDHNSVLQEHEKQLTIKINNLQTQLTQIESLIKRTENIQSSTHQNQLGTSNEINQQTNIISILQNQIVKMAQESRKYQQQCEIIPSLQKKNQQLESNLKELEQCKVSHQTQIKMLTMQLQKLKKSFANSSENSQICKKAQFFSERDLESHQILHNVLKISKSKNKQGSSNFDAFNQHNPWDSLSSKSKNFEKPEIPNMSQEFGNSISIELNMMQKPVNNSSPPQLQNQSKDQSEYWQLYRNYQKALECLQKQEKHKKKQLLKYQSFVEKIHQRIPIDQRQYKLEQQIYNLSELAIEQKETIETERREYNQMFTTYHQEFKSEMTSILSRERDKHNKSLKVQRNVY